MRACRSTITSIVPAAVACAQDYHWWPMVLVAVTCSFNLLGRGLSIPLGRIVGPTLLLVLSVGRLVFIPVFTFYMQGQDQAVMTDSSALIFVAVFAVTNGFIVHSAMNHAITKVRRAVSLFCSGSVVTCVCWRSDTMLLHKSGDGASVSPWDVHWRLRRAGCEAVAHVVHG